MGPPRNGRPWFKSKKIPRVKNYFFNRPPPKKSIRVCLGSKLNKRPVVPKLFHRAVLVNYVYQQQHQHDSSSDLDQFWTSLINSSSDLVQFGPQTEFS